MGAVLIFHFPEGSGRAACWMGVSEAGSFISQDGTGPPGRFLIFSPHLTRHGNFPPQVSDGKISPTKPQTESTTTLQAGPQQGDPRKQPLLEHFREISCGFHPFCSRVCCYSLTQMVILKAFQITKGQGLHSCDLLYCEWSGIRLAISLRRACIL